MEKSDMDIARQGIRFRALVNPLKTQFLLNGLLNYSSTLKMEAIRSSETSGATQRTTRRHIPEDDTLQVFKMLKLFLHHCCTACLDRYGHHQVTRNCCWNCCTSVSKFKPKVYPRLCSHVSWCVLWRWVIPPVVSCAAVTNVSTAISKHFMTVSVETCSATVM
jgi:hypothetical protein